jgi:hypothetical protein
MTDPEGRTSLGWISEAHPPAIGLPDAAAPYPAYRPHPPLASAPRPRREGMFPSSSASVTKGRGAARAKSSQERGTPADSRDLTVLVFGLIPDRTDREQAALKPRIRQLLCFWLVTVITLLPVSGSLPAATLAAGSDNASHDAHMGHAHHGTTPAHGAHDHHEARHGPAGGMDDSIVLAFVHHDCGSALCADGCSGCTACHAPPVNSLLSADSTDLLHAFSPVIASTPPPGAVFRPPITTTA